MERQIEIDPQAIAEAIEARQWYEDRNDSAVKKLEQEVDAAIRAIVDCVAFRTMWFIFSTTQ